MAEYTEYYNLKKPTQDENYNVDVANKNNDIIDGALQSKQEKIPGKGLSSNDFTNEYKSKIQSIDESNNKLIEKSNKLETSIKSNADNIQAINEDLEEKSDKANTATDLDVSLNQEDYILKIFLKNEVGQVLSEKEVDFPIESMIVNATYNKETKEIEMTLQNENKIKFSVADLVNGLISQTDLDKSLETLKAEIERELIENVNSEINTNYKEKTEAFNQNARDKTTEFNTNADLKVKDFNSNAIQKTDEFNQNAESYKNDIDSLKQQYDELSKNMSFNTVENETIDIDDAHSYSKNTLKIEGNSYQETREGRNIIDLTNLKTGIYCKIENNLITTDALGNYGWANMYLSDPKELLADTDYYISLDIRLKNGESNSKMNYIKFTGSSLDAGATEILNPIISSKFQRYCFKIRKDENFIIDGIGTQIINGTNAVLEYKNVMVSTSSNYKYEQYGAMPSPEFPSEIETIKTVKFKKTGKNLNVYPFSDSTKTVAGVTYTVLDNQKIKVEGTSTNTCSFNFRRNILGERLKLRKGTYTISATGLTEGLIIGSGLAKKNDKDVSINLSALTASNDKKTFSIDEDLELISYIYCQGAGYTFDTTVFFQIEKNDIATEFEPYKCEEYTLEAQKEMLKGDDFTKENEVHTWGKLILTGDEDGFNTGKWQTELKNTYGFRIYIKRSILRDTKIYSNYFKAEEKKKFWNNEKVGVACLEEGNVDFHIQKELLEDETIESFKAWLKQKYDEGNPIVVYYKLSEPELLPLTEEQKTVISELDGKFKLDEGVNHIFSDDELSPIFSLNYMQSNKILNQKKDEKIKNIESRLALLEV